VEIFEEGNAWYLTKKEQMVMSKFALVVGLATALLVSMSAFAIDGVVLINQSTVMAAGGFPYKITQPGSYKLSGNLVVPAGLLGIEIDADNVIVDLNGFSIVGPNTCDGDSRTQTTTCTNIIMFDGVFSRKSSITIRNGTIRGMRFGIFLTNGPALIEDIHATQNTSTGIKVESGVVRRNNASNNGGDGINANGSNGDSANGASVTSDNVVVGNGNNGIVAAGGTVTGNVSYLNRVGIWTWDSTVLQNTIRASKTTGLIVFRSLYGSNMLVNNQGALGIFPGSTSQNNNNCDGSGC
jgi:hypothetical protein